VGKKKTRGRRVVEGDSASHKKWGHGEKGNPRFKGGKRKRLGIKSKS